jgi:hypothetical protein
MVVASWLAAKGTDDSVGSSVEDSEGGPGCVCSLLIVNSSRFAIGRLIAFLLVANNATSARLAAQPLVGNASDSPSTVGDFPKSKRLFWKEPDSLGGFETPTPWSRNQGSNKARVIPWEARATLIAHIHAALVC